ncbi:MAG: acyl--CoA ligase, partial [Clostridia bacterium]|nr:acyl--CoA ligase [Clostridia bacterium]
MNRHKNYPLYETVVFKDFRVLVDQSAELYHDSPAISYKNNPNDEETVRVTYSEAAEDIRALGTELIARGLRDRKCAIVGLASRNWIYSYFSLMAIGAVTVPLDKELPAPDLAATIKKAGSFAVFYGAEIGPRLDTIRAESG